MRTNIKTAAPRYALHNDDIFTNAEACVSNKNLCVNVIIPHVCNNINAFGAGFAQAIATRYPFVKENFHMLTGSQRNLGHVQYVKAFSSSTHKAGLYVANMIAQNGLVNPKNTRPLNYEALVRSMIDVRKFLYTLYDTTHGTTEIHCPKFGSALAGGSWDFISDLIEDIWVSHKIPVHVYNPPRKN